jgi:hypothetical protein
MQRSRRYLLAETILIIALTAITNAAQTTTRSFNPQTRLRVGSRIIIRSVYGIATPGPHNQPSMSQPPHWNQTQQNLPSYNMSITIDVQISGDAINGGITFRRPPDSIRVQGGTFIAAGPSSAARSISGS